MRGLKKGISVVTAATLFLTALPVNGIGTVYAAGTSDGQKAATVDANVLLQPSSASPFHDTDGDGLGEFEGWGTSLCWWANRLGYDTTLTEKAATAFFSDEGLDMNIGRYNIGGGDCVGEVKELTQNEKAQIFGVEKQEGVLNYNGSSMKISSIEDRLKTATYLKSDADFGFTKGKAVGEKSAIGYVNKLGDAVGTGDNLHYTVNATDAGDYTVKLLLMHNANTTRDVAIRVNSSDTDSTKDYVVDNAAVKAGQIVEGSGANQTLFLVTIPNVVLKAGANTIDVAGNAGWTLDFVNMLVVKSDEMAALPDEFLHAPHIQRSDSIVPGYCTNVTKMQITETQTLDKYKQEFNRVDETSGYAWNYDWDADKNQMNILKAAAAASGTDFIAEAFSNSPPYFMTNSGCSSGAVDANSDNLRADCYDAFAAYMADVIEHWKTEGVITFQSATPMNEPYTDYWGANSNKQEGCHFDQGTSQSNVIVALNKALQEKGINLIISGTDETSIDTQITSYNELTEEAKNIVTRIDTHTYSGSNRGGLSTLAEEANKNLWMSEVDGAYTAGTNAGEMTAGLGLAERIITDLKGLRSSAWILWNAVDNHVDADASRDGGFDADTLEQLYASKADGGKGLDLNKGYWGIAFADHNNKELVLTKKYEAFGQFSKYIRPGYTIIGSTGNTLAAYDPDGQKVVIVAVNTAGEDKTWNFNLESFKSMGNQITANRTSGSMAEGEKWADVTASDDIVADTVNRSFTATVKANSITTYTVEGVTYDRASDESVAVEEIALNSNMVTGSEPYNNGADVQPEKVVDGKLDTFFDGLEAGWIQIDLGETKEIAGVGYAPRNGYAYRCKGGAFYGSNDEGTEKNWTLLYNIKDEPAAGSITRVDANQFETDKTAYRYIKYALATKESNSAACNIAEIKLYQSTMTLADFLKLYQDRVTDSGKVYTAETKKAFDDAANAVKALVDANSTDVVAIADAKAALKAAYKALEIDLPLSDFIKSYQDKVAASKKLYTLESWNVYKAAVKTAQDLVDSSSSDTTAIANAKKGIKEAFEGLVEDAPVTDFIDEYQNKLDASGKTYTQASLKVFNDAIAELQKLVASTDPEAVAAAKKAVEDAYKALEEDNSLAGAIAYYQDRVTNSGKEYTATSKKVFDDAIAAAQKLVTDNETDAAKIAAAKKAIKDAYDALEELKQNYTSFSGVDGDVYYDTEGKVIQAHGGQIQQFTVNGKTKWYWIGEDKTNDYRPCPGIHMYSSDDLYNWKDEGVVLKTARTFEEFKTDEYFTNLYGDLKTEEEQKRVFTDIWQGENADEGCVIERPKMLYNDKTKKYVIWFHADGQDPFAESAGGNYAKAKAGVAIADSPTGPYKLLGSYLLNYEEGADHGFDGDVGGHVRDMNLFKDDDGTAYVLYSSDGNQTMHIAKLNDEYTNVAQPDNDLAVQGKDFTRNFIGESREAPAMFKYKDKYYLITSGCTGWSPNRASYAVADHPLGPWKTMGDPCTDENSNYTYYTQSTCVIPVDPAKGKFIYMGDRWYNPEVSVGPAAGGQLRDSRYVWVPVELIEDGEEIALRSRSDWSLEELNYSCYSITPKTPDTVSSLEELQSVFPAKVTFNYTNGETKEEAVTWSNLPTDEKTIGSITITGSMENGRSIKRNVSVLNKNLIYFFDCSAEESEYLEKVKKAANNKLRNTEPDQAYSILSYAGYTGKLGVDFGIKTSTKDMWGQGYWAEGGKNLTYAFDLEPGTYTVATGYQEWWNTSRKTKITATGSNGTELTSTEFTLANSDTELQKNITFKLEKADTVTVSISKTGNPDPVLSWIAVIQDEQNGKLPDKQELQTAMTQVNNLKKEDYPAASWKEIQKVYEEVAKVQANLQATPEEIAQAAAKLNKVLKSLKTMADLLEEGIAANLVPDSQKGNYTTESWNFYQQMLKAAQALLKEEKLQEAEIEDAIKVLEDAKFVLEPKKNNNVEKPKADKNDLEAMYNSCKKKKKGTYTDTSWNNFQKAITAAKKVLDNKNATQKNITDALKKLETTRYALSLKKEQSIKYTKTFTKAFGAKAFSLGAKRTTGNGALSYKTSDKKVATVAKNGKVTIKGTGKCTITITAKATGTYKAKSVKVTLTVKPKKAAISKLTLVKGKKLKITWKKDSKATGYEIQCALKKDFKKIAKKATIKKSGTTSTTLTKLTKGKKYYVRVRAYKNIKVSGKTKKLVGAWSTVKLSGKIK